MRNHETVTELRDRLRRGDPATGGQDLSPAQIAQMRREVLAAAEEAPSERRSPVRFGVFAAAAASLVLVVGGLWLTGNGDSIPTSPPRLVEEAERPSLPVLATDEARPARQLQFSTPGGTRVIWTLDPDFEV